MSIFLGGDKTRHLIYYNNLEVTGCFANAQFANVSNWYNTTYIFIFKEKRFLQLWIWRGLFYSFSGPSNVGHWPGRFFQLAPLRSAGL